jgi:hypothetical protein
LQAASKNDGHLSKRQGRYIMAPTPDLIAAQRQALRRNIERYSRLLETELTENERANLHKRMAEDWAVLSRLNQATGAAASEIRNGTPTAVM